MVKSCVTLVRLCPSGLAYNMRQPQEVTLRVIRVFPVQTFVILRAAGLLPLWDLCKSWGSYVGKETIKLPWRSPWGHEPKGRRAGPGGLSGPG